MFVSVNVVVIVVNDDDNDDENQTGNDNIRPNQKKK